MNQAPRITITKEHWHAANESLKGISANYSLLGAINKAIEIALAEQANEQYITAEEARKLGAGKAEWRYPNETDTWKLCEEGMTYTTGVKFRAIIQPELLDLSNLKGVGRNFEIKQPEPVEPHAELKANLVKLDGELMTREAAVAKWESKKGMCEVWFKSPINNWVHCFGADFLFVWNAKDGEYQLRAKQVSWTGSREDVIALLIELGVTK